MLLNGPWHSMETLASDDYSAQSLPAKLQLMLLRMQLHTLGLRDNGFNSLTTACMQLYANC